MGAALLAASLGFVVFHLVRISYVFASFLEPVLVRFSTKFADSENSLPQGACLKGFREMLSARLDSHRYSVQNCPAESFPALTGTIFVNVFDFCIFRTISGPKNHGQNQQAPLKKPGGCRPPDPPQSGGASPPRTPPESIPHPAGRPPSRANKTKQNKMRQI